MAVMTATADDYPAAGSGPMTVRDLEGMPDDGRRYELIDGMLIVSPAPGRKHQRVGYRLFAVLDEVCPPECEVVGAPFAVHSGDEIELQPDVLVGYERDFTDSDLPAPPLLAVEVLSPSTALNDLNTKKAAYARLGVPSYWVIDPEGSSMRVFELEDGDYRQVAKVSGAEPFDARRPFPARIVPNELLGRLAER